MSLVFVWYLFWIPSLLIVIVELSIEIVPLFTAKYNIFLRCRWMEHCDDGLQTFL